MGTHCGLFLAQYDFTEVIESLGRCCVVGLGANFGNILLGLAKALVVALERGTGLPDLLHVEDLLIVVLTLGLAREGLALGLARE